MSTYVYSTLKVYMRAYKIKHLSLTILVSNTTRTYYHYFPACAETALSFLLVISRQYRYVTCMLDRALLQQISPSLSLPTSTTTYSLFGFPRERVRSTIYKYCTNSSKILLLVPARAHKQVVALLFFNRTTRFFFKFSMTASRSSY